MARYWRMAPPGHRARESGHQPPACGLVERIQLHEPRGGRDRRRGIAALLRRRDEALQHLDDSPLHGDGTRGPPVVEVGAVPEREPGEERAAREGRGLRQRGRIAAWMPASSAARSSHTPSPCGASATVDRSTRSHRSPSAERSTDSVRRSALRADSSSDSGQNSAASSSRAYGRRSTASSATIADALRVSTRIGSPSTWTSSGPRTRISSDMARNGTTSARDPVTFRERPIPIVRCHDRVPCPARPRRLAARHARHRCQRLDPAAVPAPADRVGADRLDDRASDSGSPRSERCWWTAGRTSPCPGSR